ncbi:MAG: HDOD domain-containing protein [Psychromonas sp.]|nr:HDOD domain-containing protein [Psychromonas sp.]
MVEKVKRTEQQWVRILAQKEMPAITSVASMLDQFSNDDISSIPHLSKAILHDQGLSSCLLKVANNSQRIAVSKINTVSRAAIVIGIRAVKNICITSKILEGLLTSNNLAPEVHHRLTMLMAKCILCRVTC